MTGLELMLACALHVAPQTIQAVIQVESHGHELALHVNGVELDRQPVTLAEAIATARSAIAQGYTVDLGLMQVNSRNLDRLGYSIEQIFDPCINLRAGSAILFADYAAAVRVYGEGQTALRAALSAYNSGDFERGFRNGYVARYYASSHALVAHPTRAFPRKALAADPNLAGMAIFTRKETDDGLE